MNAQILCIGGSVALWRKWRQELEADGYVIVHASDETEAVELLKAAPVDVVCIDSRAMGEAGRSVIGASLKNTRPRVPVVLIQNGSHVPTHLEEHVDVVTDESTFTTMGRWLIEDLRELRFPLFMERLDEWKQRRAHPAAHGTRLIRSERRPRDREVDSEIRAGDC